MRQCTEAELESIQKSLGEFHQQKGAVTQQTPYGLSYSPHYLRQSRAVKDSGPDGGGGR